VRREQSGARPTVARRNALSSRRLAGREPPAQAGLRARKWHRTMPVRSPSRAWAQWHWERTWPAYRCGGSAGITSRWS